MVKTGLGEPPKRRERGKKKNSINVQNSNAKPVDGFAYRCKGKDTKEIAGSKFSQEKEKKGRTRSGSKERDRHEGRPKRFGGSSPKATRGNNGGWVSSVMGVEEKNGGRRTPVHLKKIDVGWDAGP